VIQMRNAQFYGQFVSGAEFVQGEQQGGGVGAAGNGDDHGFIGKRELQFPPFGEQHAGELIESGCSELSGSHAQRIVNGRAVQVNRWSTDGTV
jgi:hypothetical protein